MITYSTATLVKKSELNQNYKPTKAESKLQAYEYINVLKTVKNSARQKIAEILLFTAKRIPSDMTDRRNP